MMKNLILLSLSLLILVLTGFSEIAESVTSDAVIKLTLASSDKEEIRTQGIQNQEILIKVKTKERIRKTDSITEIWLTAWSTYEGSTVKNKLHRFMEDSRIYDEPIVFRHYDKRNGMKEIRINVQVEINNDKVD